MSACKNCTGDTEDTSHAEHNHCPGSNRNLLAYQSDMCKRINKLENQRVEAERAAALAAKGRRWWKFW